MKKYLIFLFSFFFACNVTAQKPLYLVSNDVNAEGARFTHATADNEHYFLIRIEKESKKANLGYFDIYNRASMKRESSQPLSLPAKEATQLTIRELKAIGDYIFVLYDYVSQMDEMNHSALLLLDKTGKTAGTSMELNVAKDRMKRFMNQRGEEYIGTGLHLDARTGNYVMVSFINISKIGMRQIYTVPEATIRVLDGSGNILNEKKLPLELCASEIMSQEMDNNGNLYLVFNALYGKDGIDYFTLDYKPTSKDKYECTVVILSADSWNVKTYHPGYDGKKEKYRIRENGFYKSTDGRVLLAGLYKNENDGDDFRRGVYAGWFDKDGLFKGDHEAPWTETPEQKAKNNITLGYYGLKTVHICEDNSIKYLLSKNYIKDYTEMRSGHFLEASVSPTFVLSMKYGMHGTKMDKDYRSNAFPTELCTDNDSYFFFNDQEKNLNKEMSDNYTSISGSEMKESVKPCFSHFTKSGSVKSQVFISEVKSETNVLIQSDIALMINDSELLLPATIGGRTFLMKIWLEEGIGK